MMKYLLVNFAAIFSLNVFASCKKTDAPSNPAPSNIVISATVSTDGTGNVDFKVTATNAVTYSFEFGNGGLVSGASSEIFVRMIQEKKIIFRGTRIDGTKFDPNVYIAVKNSVI